MKNQKIAMKLISRENIESIFKNDPGLPLHIVEKAFEKRARNRVLLPDKISQVFNEVTQERINCMPATLLDEEVCGVKWVSVFPPNSEKQLLNVTGVILLSSLKTGYPLAMIDGTYITAVRTAAVGAIAVKYLSRKESTTIGFIGAGEQARMHFKIIRQVRPIKECYVASRREATESGFIAQMQDEYPDVKFVPCNSNYRKAAEKADIIVTAVSCQQPLLKAQYVKPGATYIHVGGWEDEYAVAQMADKIVCDEWESVKHRSQTLSRMYYDGLLTDGDVYADIGEIISGKKAGRENDDEFIYFNSVGLAFIDMMFAHEIYKFSQDNALGTCYCIQG
ncbi:MAG: ornithine cyclodeaminase family protein [Tissierellia bacterium]|nr:ornithine cyclodeaminase family protein [Tissierellia bacterium]